MSEEKNVDIKGTFEKFIKADEPEMTQEEAIKSYKEERKAIKKSKGSVNDEGEKGINSEEQEHLKRVKQELLASLERVKQLEKQIYGEDNKEKEKLKVKESNTGEKYIHREENKKSFETMTIQPEQKERD